MACISITALPKPCGTVEAGVEKAYMIAYKDLGVATTSTTGSVYVEATNGMINDIGLATGKTFVEIGLLQRSSDVTTSMSKKVENATEFWTVNYTLYLSDLSTENYAFVTSVKSQPVAVLIKSKTGNFFVAGLNGRMELEKADAGTGKAEGDNMGYTLTFTGTQGKPLQIVDPTIVAGLI